MVRRLLPRVYEGWIVVGGAGFIILTIGASFFWGFGAIFNEMVDEFGWSVVADSRQTVLPTAGTWRDIHFAAALAGSSTIVAIRQLRQLRQTREPFGRLVVSVQLLQDFLLVGMLVLVSAWPQGWVALLFAMYGVSSRWS